MGSVASDLCTLAFDSIYDAFINPTDTMGFLIGLRDAYAEGLKTAAQQLDRAIMAGLVAKYLWFFGYLLSAPDARAGTLSEPREQAMRLVLAAGSWLRRHGHP